MRRYVIPLVLVGIGLLSLLALQWKLDLGSFAKSPQLLEIPWGTRAILGGGRAGLDFDGLEGERAVFRLWCADGEVELRMEPGELTDEICGVRIRLLGVVDGRRPDDPPRAAIEVTWDPADSWDPEGAKGAKSTS